MSLSAKTIVLVSGIALSSGVAAAEGAQPAPDAPTGYAPYSPYTPTTNAGAQPGAPAGTLPQEEKVPHAGDFDAGGQVRLPNGPDEQGTFASFNWVAVDLKGRYFVSDRITFNANVPVAIIHPDTVGDPALDVHPSMIGGFSVRAEAMAGTQVGLTLAGGFMREGAFNLGEKDYPLFVGDFKPGLTVGPIVKFKLGSLLNITTTPLVALQSGTGDSHDAIQVPLSAMVKLGSLLQVSADAGVYTGDHLELGPAGGGRVAAGASITAKLGPILAHLGAGVASLFTDPMGPYPTSSDSVYLDVNVKYVK